MAIVKDKKRHPTASQRIEILKEIERSGNVTQACKQYGVSRASFYSWLQKHKENPSSGLDRKKPVTSRANKTKQNVVERVIDLAIRNPDSGCAINADLLLQEGSSLSPPTVQKILNKAGLGTVSRRLFRLEKHHILDGWPVSDRQLELINRNDPCLKERGNTGCYPFEILVQDCFPIFQLIPGCYVHVIIDTFSSTAFVFPCFEKSAFLAADVLQHVALRRYRLSNLFVRKVLTNNAYIFSRKGKLFSDCCKKFSIEHQIYNGRNKNWNGHIERYKKFFFHKYRHMKYEKLDIAQVNEMIGNMKHPTSYNKKRVYEYPNLGMTPEERMKQFSELKAKNRNDSSTFGELGVLTIES
jgi:transposase-like protein